MKTHSCLVCRAARVSERYVTCRSCWRAVPGRLQERLVRTWAMRVRDPRPHREALAELLSWARDHASVPVR